VLVIAADQPSRFAHDMATTPWLDGLLVRRNIGYDFGSWRAGLTASPQIARASLLALANDSVYGPLDGFDAMLARVDASQADIVGVIESFERLHHLQSFLVFYKPAALHAPAFRQFWKIVSIGGREDVIVQRELRFLFDMLLANIKVDVLFPSERGSTLNPTLCRWRELLDAGFPFIKVQLLRENPKGADIDGWEIELTKRGYDPAAVVLHLGQDFAKSAAADSLARTAGIIEVIGP
jgi:lipopolysaccharide biosynthesis protein